MALNIHWQAKTSWRAKKEQEALTVTLKLRINFQNQVVPSKNVLFQILIDVAHSVSGMLDAHHKNLAGPCWKGLMEYIVS